MATEVSLWSLFKDTVSKHAKRDAFLIDGKEHVSYQQLHDRVVRLAGFLQSKGVLGSSKVLIQCESPVSMSALILACDYIGAKIVIANMEHGVHSLDDCLKNIKPNVIIHDTLKSNQRLAARAEKLSIASGIEWQDSPKSWSEIHSLEPLVVDEQAGKSLIFASDQGPEGDLYTFEPSNKQIFDNVEKVVNHFEITKQTRIMHTMRWTSRIGLFVLFHGFCASGASATISTQLTYRKQLEQMVNADFYIDSATKFIEMIDGDMLAGVDEFSAPSVMLCVCGSLSNNYQLEFFRRYQRRVFIAYGRSLLGFIGASHASDTVPSYGWYSSLISEQKMSVKKLPFPPITDEWSRDARSIGELIFTDASGEQISSDIYGKKNSDDSVTIYGPLKNFSSMLGLCLSEYEVEVVLMANPHIRDCAVISLNHPRYETALAALVVFDKEASAKDGVMLLRTLSGKIARYKIPKKAILLNSLRRNKFGEVDKLYYKNHYADIYQAVEA